MASLQGKRVSEAVLSLLLVGSRREAWFASADGFTFLSAGSAEPPFIVVVQHGVC